MSDEITISTYFVVALYPIVMLIIPEPVSLRWWLRNGSGKPMPSEIARRSEENEGYLLMAKFLILVGTTIGLMRHTLVPPSRLGFRPIDLRAAVAFGLIAGFMLSLWILSMRAVALRMCES